MSGMVPNIDAWGPHGPFAGCNREVDWGWLPDADGTRARLTWRESDGAVYLFHANTNGETVLARGVSERAARLFFAEVDHLRRRCPLTVTVVREASDVLWSF